MRKNFILGIVIAAIAVGFSACGGSSHMTKSTSTRVDLAHSVRVIPSIANVDVNPTRITATANASELESLNNEQMKQAVVAKALATVNGDVMLAPEFSTKKGTDGKLASMTVTGYAATITSFRTMTEADVEIDEKVAENAKQNCPKDKLALNTMTVAEVEYGAKKTITIPAAELAGMKEAAALKYAKEKLLRQEKMDVLYSVQYTVSIDNGAISSFKLSAFPGKFVNYRQTTLSEQMALKPSSSPVVYFKTIAADIKTVGNRVQLRLENKAPEAKEAEIKENARVLALNHTKADFLLNETFYFDYKDKAITHVTICGTPAVYANFRPLKEGEFVDVKLVPFAGDAENAQPVGFFDMIKNLFKKK